MDLLIILHLGELDEIHHYLLYELYYITLIYQDLFLYFLLFALKLLLIKMKHIWSYIIYHIILINYFILFTIFIFLVN
jgi:hypothetical protein